MQTGGNPCGIGVHGRRANILRAGFWTLATGVGMVCLGVLVGGGSAGGCRVVDMGQPDTPQGHTCLTGARSHRGERGVEGLSNGGRSRVKSLGHPGRHGAFGNAVWHPSGTLGRPTHPSPAVAGIPRHPRPAVKSA